MVGEDSLFHPDKAEDHSVLEPAVLSCYLRALGPKTKLFRFLDMNLLCRIERTTGTEKLLYSFGTDISNLF
jgi:hypothetical protein